MTLLFIDTSIWYNAYRVRPHPPSWSAIKAIPRYMDFVISSEFQISEFLKGRTQAIREGISGLDQNHAPPILHQWNAGSRIEHGRTYLPAIQSDPSIDPVYQALKHLRHARHFQSMHWLEDEEILQQARRRKDLNMAPSKPKDPTLGDQIHWLLCLAVCREAKEDLLICTADADFGELGNPGQLNDSLVAEFTSAVGTGANAQIFHDLAPALAQLPLPNQRAAAPYKPYKGSIPGLLRD